MFNANLSGSSPACVLTGLLRVSKFEMETNVGSTWNWMSSFFCWSLRELRKPGLRLEKALSFGANRVRPPLVVYQVDKVLLPRDFFEAKPPAPAPAPEKAKGSKKKSVDSTATPADDAESDAVSVKQWHVMWVASVVLLVAAFTW